MFDNESLWYVLEKDDKYAELIFEENLLEGCDLISFSG